MGPSNGWTVGPNPLPTNQNAYYFSKKHKIMRFLVFFFLQYNFIPTENDAPGDDKPWITRKFGLGLGLGLGPNNLYINCA